MDAGRATGDPRAVRRSTTLALVVMIGLSLPSVARAGPWSPEPGHGYVKLWFKYFYGFTYLAGDGTAHALAYHEANLSAYAELGLAHRVALVVHSPIVQSFTLEDPRNGTWESHLSPGDPALSLRWQFLAVDRFVAAVEAGVRAPFARPGTVQTVYSHSDGNPAIGALRVGTGVWDFPLTLGVGYGADQFYLAGSVGWVMRTDGYDHVLTWSVEGGTTVERLWGIRGRLVGWHAVHAYFGEPQPGHESPSGIGNGTSYTGFALEMDYQFQPSWFAGVTIEGGTGLLVRQAGGPVITLYLATRF